VHVISDMGEWADSFYEAGFLRRSLVRLALLGPLVVVFFVWQNHSVHVMCKRIHDEMYMSTKVVGQLSPDCFAFDPADGRWHPADRLSAVDLDIF